MKKFSIKLVGDRPLLMHSARGVDPDQDLVKLKKALNDKRNKKTDDDIAMIDWCDYQLSMYFHHDHGPVLPSDNIFKALVEGARKTRQGKQVEQGVFLDVRSFPLIYNGPRDVKELYADANFVNRTSVVIGQQRIIRVRPVFRQWQATATGTLDEGMVSWADLEKFAFTAGTYVGVGDWRPRYGTFTAEVKAL